MEISGKLLQVLPVQEIQGKNGPMQKHTFVIETQEQYPKKVCFSAWGDKTGDLKQSAAGDMLKVQFSLESREYQGRWYTEAKAYRIEKSGAGRPAEASWPGSDSIPPPQAPSFDAAPDDLPF
ncbi:MAG: DUF3127 domain-containing protein [Bacteroidales bacterium]